MDLIPYQDLEKFKRETLISSLGALSQPYSAYKSSTKLYRSIFYPYLSSLPLSSIWFGLVHLPGISNSFLPVLFMPKPFYTPFALL